MPALFAHDLFGRRVLPKLSDDLQQIIKDYYAPFQIGLQGPDLFFFYRPFSHNRVRTYGSHLHEISALPFFEHGAEIIKNTGRKTKEYAYLLGFICHYILDSECHPYVEERIEESGVEHLEIEEEFEKKLLRMDRKDPVGFPLDTLVPTDSETAEAILPFYSEVDLRTVKQSLKDLKAVKHLFTAPGAFKQTVLNTAFRLSGKYRSMKGLMNQRRDNPKCVTSSEGLLLRFNIAIEIAASMIHSFDHCIRTGEPLHPRFDRTFE